MRSSSFASLAAPATLLLAVAAAQAPQHRLTYRVEVVRANGAGRQSLAFGEVSGSIETGLRLSLRSDSAEVEALFAVFSETDTATLTAEFFSKRRLGTSRRGLPLWEQDGYTRIVQVAWGDTARVYPLGPPQRGAPDSVWVDLTVLRRPAGGEVRPAETLTLGSGPFQVALQAVVRPRRVVVVLTLVHGRAVSAPRRYDLIPEGEAKRVQLPVPGRLPRVLEVALSRPEMTGSARDRTLALEADVVCLRVAEPDSLAPTGTVCGRPNNVMRRLPLPGSDTLIATFAWPGSR